MKKKFSETKVGGLLKVVAEGALDVLPIPDVRNYFKKDTGKVDYLKIAGAVAVLSLLLYFGIVDIEQIKQLIEALVG